MGSQKAVCTILVDSGIGTNQSASATRERRYPPTTRKQRV